MYSRLELAPPPNAFRLSRNEAHVYRELDLQPQTWVRRFDERGKVIEESLFQSNGSLMFRWIYLYDEYARKIKGNLHGGEGMLLATCFYDENGDVTRRHSYNCGQLAVAA